MENDRVCTFKSERSEHIHTSSSETQHSVALLCLDKSAIGVFDFIVCWMCYQCCMFPCSSLGEMKQKPNRKKPPDTLFPTQVRLLSSCTELL